MAIKKCILVAMAGAAVLATGCSSTVLGLGPHQGSPGETTRVLAPQLVKEPPAFEKLVWWNPGAFGQVPDDLKAAGQEFCGCMDTETVKYTAIGYHPYAMGPDSYPMKGGGYLCAQTAASK
ncbi:MAG: hypothetical protein FIB06_02760 [Betaproteobacteria bacterium]|nr:hypothetical protein [Betaproteobacteria bacterium]